MSQNVNTSRRTAQQGYVVVRSTCGALAYFLLSMLNDQLFAGMLLIDAMFATQIFNFNE